MGRTEAAPGSQSPCLRCGREAACDECAASLAEARERVRARRDRCEARIATAGLSLDERKALYGSGSVDLPEPRRRVRDPWGHGRGVRPKRGLTEDEAAQYVAVDGHLVNGLTGELAHSDG